MTFAEADVATRELAAGLVAGGRGPRRPDLPAVADPGGMGAVRRRHLDGGGVTVPIYGSNTAEQCEFIVRDAGAKLVIVEDDGQRDKVASIRDACQR